MGQSEIHRAATTGDAPAVVAAIGSGADVNARDSKGYTSLHLAVVARSYAVAETLIKAGADVNARTFRGLTALELAVRFDEKKIVRLLLDSGADIQPLRVGDSAMFEAIQKNDIGLVREFLSHDVDLSLQNHGEETALFYAAYLGRDDIAKLLIAHGANVNALAKDSRTALHAAVFSNHQAIADLLLASGAKVYATEESEEGLYSTAMLYEFLAKHEVRAGKGTSAIESFELAADYYDKSEALFRDRAGKFGQAITTARVGNLLSMVFAAAHANVRARNSMVPTPSGRMVGFGTASYRVQGTTDLASMKRSYLTVAESSAMKVRRMRGIAACIKATKMSLEKCIQ